MKTKINQWLMLRGEIFDNDQNSKRYLDMLLYSIHQDMQLYQNTVCKNGKKIDIMTIVTDDKEVYDEFCAMANKVKGLYGLSDIFDSVSRVLSTMRNQ